MSSISRKQYEQGDCSAPSDRKSTWDFWKLWNWTRIVVLVLIGVNLVRALLASFVPGSRRGRHFECNLLDEKVDDIGDLLRVQGVRRV